MDLKDKISDYNRTFAHFFFKSGNMSKGIDHFLVAFPSILLMAKLLSDNNFDENSISLILFSVGVCNIIFYFITNFKIPIFLGPSFAFIGFMSTSMDVGEHDINFAKYNVLIGYIISSIIFLIIASLYKSSKIRKYVRLTLPDALVGPLISLIGLDLLNTAISDSGFHDNNRQSIIVALFTLCVIIIATVFKRKYLKNASILLGVIAGIIFSCVFMNYTFNIIGERSMIALPKFNRIELNDFSHIEYINIIMAVLPATIVVFTENITKITLLEEILRTDNKFKDTDWSIFYQNSIIGHSVSYFISVIIGSVPNTVYVQNVALMGLNNIDSYSKKKVYPEKRTKLERYYNTYTFYPLLIAATIAIFCSFFTLFQSILTAIPKAVYGGMELFVFAIISAQGVQLLVDRKVNYKKVTNQIITSSTLLAGLSGISIDLNIAKIDGLSLALLVGVSLNLIFKSLSFYGFINEKLSLSEIIEICLPIFKEQNDIVNDNSSFLEMTFNKYQYISITEGNDGVIIIKVKPFKDKYIEIINDYSQNTLKVGDEGSELAILINEKMSIYALKKICRKIAAD